MKKIAFISLLVCAAQLSAAQTNFVKNPSFEDTVKCPNEINQIGRAKYWNCAVDTAGDIDGHQYYAPEYYNACAGTTAPVRCAVPNGGFAHQFARTGNAYMGAQLYYDKTPPPPPIVGSSNWRDYAQGHLHKPLQKGKTYCINFWVVLAETSGYAHNSIGAYLDNGNINKRSPAGDMITDVIPQFATAAIIKDTQNWVKVEGSFVASGNETHITLGNFAKQADVDTTSDLLYYAFLTQYSYYLIDDVSVIPIDLAADAGKDTWVPVGSNVKIGRVGDTTAQGLDCKWYKKGVLIDSGAIITVSANSIINKVDTYVVVQTVCGLVKSDTVLVKTTSLGIKEYQLDNEYTLFPNPNNGSFVISQNTSSLPPASLLDKHHLRPKVKQSQTLNIKVYNAIGSLVYQSEATFVNGQVSVNLGQKAQGLYLVCLSDEQQKTTCLKFNLQ